LLQLVGSSVLLYLVDDARSNENQGNFIVGTKITNFPVAKDTKPSGSFCAIRPLH